MSVKLYKLNLGPPSRSTMMACEIFNAPVEMIETDVIKGENRTEEFLKLNPLHSVPTLSDGDLAIHDSHTILAYLADKYGKDDSWYPKDLKQRTLVNQKLFFEANVLYAKVSAVTTPFFWEGVKTVTEKQINGIQDAYDFLEKFLERTKFLATDHMTIADLSAFVTVNTMTYITPLNPERHPKSIAWFETMESQPFSKKYNAAGAKALGEMLKEGLIKV